MARIPAAIALLAWAWVTAVEAGSLRGVQQIDVLQELIDLLVDEAATNEPPLSYLGVRVNNATEAMRPIFLSLPQAAEGYLEATATHYLLHRYFIDQYGWTVQGSAAVGEAAGDNLPEVLLGALGGTFSEMLTAQLRSRGLSLRDVAVLAIALEFLAMLETRARLLAAYGLAGDHQYDKELLEEEMQEVYKVYLQIYVLGHDVSELTRGDVQTAFNDIYNRYPMWDSMVSWVQEVRAEVLADYPEERGTFDGETRVLQAMQHRYGGWQDQACTVIKAGFREYVVPGTGRMPLTTFYASDIPNAMGWQPTESEEYLQVVGALDTTDPESPSVVMSNYFDTPSNCAGPSQFYDVCCISECEALLGHLEKQLGSPKAPVQQIVGIVEGMSSATVEAPRSLPGQLVRRLESVADTHGGHAPLHGRLFLQWMHHAFPAECPMPPLDQKSALHKPMHSADFEEQVGVPATITPEKLEMYLAAANKDKAASPARWDLPATLEMYLAAPATAEELPLSQELPWSQEEELFIVCRADEAAMDRQSRDVPPGSPATLAKGRSAGRGVSALRVLGPAGFMLVIVAVTAHLLTTVKSLKATILPLFHPDCKDKAKQLV